LAFAEIHPTWIAWGHQFVLRRGVALSVIILTLCAVAGSVIIVEAVQFLSSTPERWLGRVLSVLVPALIAPIVLAPPLIILRRIGQLRRSVDDTAHTYQALLDSIPAAVTYVDTNRCYQYVNKTYEDWLGVERNSVVGHPVREIIGDKSYDSVSDAIEDALQGKGATFEIQREFSVQGAMYGQLTFAPDIGLDGSVRGYFTLLTDVSENHAFQQRFRDFAEASSDWFWETDADDRYTYFSGRDIEVSGLAHTSKIGKTRREVNQLFDPDHQGGQVSPEVQEIEANVKARLPFSDFRYTLSGAEGKRRYISVSGKPYFRADGGFAGYRGTGSDLTDRKSADDAFLELQHMYRQLVDISADAIILQTTENGRIAFANDATRQLIGAADGEDIIGQDFVDFIHPDFRADAQARNRTVLSGGKAEPNMPGQLVRHDGTALQVERSVTLCAYEGKPAFISVVRDISDRHEAQQALEDSTARLASILTIAPIAIIAVREDGMIELFNAGAEEIFGFEAADVIGRNLNMLIPARYHKSHIGYISGFAKSSDKVRQMTDRNAIHALHRDGHEFPAEASISREDHPTGTLMTVALRDITERRQAEEKLRVALVDAEQANQAKSDFLATMSHELRTPLNAIIGFSDMIEGQYFGALGSEKYSEYAHDIHSSSEHLLALVNDILDLSAIEAGKQPLLKEDVDFEDLARECIQVIIAAAREKNIAVSVEVADDVPPLFADRRAIKQILFNLLSNAVKYTPDDGKIIVTAGDWNDAQVFSVADTGVGVPSEKLAGLTDPFVRTESDPHKAQEGTGLGLAIVKSLTDLHGGKVEITSEVGVGTTVSISLPRQIS